MHIFYPVIFPPGGICSPLVVLFMWYYWDSLVPFSLRTIIISLMAAVTLYNPELSAVHSYSPEEDMWQPCVTTLRGGARMAEETAHTLSEQLLINTIFIAYWSEFLISICYSMACCKHHEIVSTLTLFIFNKIVSNNNTLSFINLI